MGVITPYSKTKVIILCLLLFIVAGEVSIGQGKSAHISLADDPWWVEKQLLDSNCFKDTFHNKCEETLKSEQDVMIWLKSKGYPVPQVKSSLETHRNGPALVMEYIKGNTMKESFLLDSENRTHTRKLAHLLAGLHMRLHRITEAPASWRQKIPQELPVFHTESHGELIPLHLDFKPQNVIISDDPRKGPAVVIDWESTVAGNQTESRIQSAYTAISILLHPTALFDNDDALPNTKTRIEQQRKRNDRRVKVEAFVSDFIDGFPLDESKEILSHVSLAAQLGLFLWPDRDGSHNRLKQMASSNSLFLQEHRQSMSHHKSK